MSERAAEAGFREPAEQQRVSGAAAAWQMSSRSYLQHQPNPFSHLVRNGFRRYDKKKTFALSSFKQCIIQIKRERLIFPSERRRNDSGINPRKLCLCTPRLCVGFAWESEASLAGRTSPSRQSASGFSLANETGGGGDTHTHRHRQVNIQMDGQIDTERQACRQRQRKTDKQTEADKDIDRG